MTEHNSQGQYFSIIPHWIIFSGVSSGAIHLFAVLAKYADYDTHEAYPSRTTLAKGIKKSVDTVDRHVKELQGIGALLVTKRKKPGSQENQTNVYELIYEQPPSDEVAAPVRPGSEDKAEVAASVRPGVVVPVPGGGGKDAAENETHLTKPTINQNLRLKQVPLSRAKNALDNGDLNFDDVELPASRQRPRLRSADQKVRADADTIAMLRKSLDKAG